MRKWKLTFCLPHGLTPNGMTSWALNTAGHLGARGWPTVIFAYEPCDMGIAWRAEEIAAAYQTDVIPLPQIDDSGAWQTIQSAFAQSLPAIFFPSTVEQCFEQIAALSLHRGKDVRCVGWNHLNHEYEYAIFKHFMPLFDLLITNTDSGNQRLRNIAGATAIDIHQTHHLPCPLVDDQTGQSLREQKRRDHPIRIAYAGRFEDTAKRVSDLVAIAAALVDRGVPFEMTLVGTGPLLDQLQQHAHRLSTQNNPDIFRIRPPLPPHHMGTFWESQDVLLLPSAYEGQSMQLLEAMRHGCVPVVSQGAAAGVRLVRDQATALIFDIGDIEGAADRLEQLVQNPSLVTQLSQQAHDEIMYPCNPSLTTDLLDRSLHQLINADQNDSANTLTALHNIESNKENGASRAAKTPSDRATGASHRQRRWPLERPLSMRADMTDRDTQVEAVQRFSAAVRKVQARGLDRIAIYGAGRHTRSLAAALANCKLDVRCIIDDDARLHGTRLWGWPIVSRDETPAYDVQAVILSSKMNEAYLLTHRAYFEQHQIAVFPLYANESSPIENTNAEVTQSNLNAIAEMEVWSR